MQQCDTMCDRLTTRSWVNVNETTIVSVDGFPIEHFYENVCVLCARKQKNNQGTKATTTKCDGKLYPTTQCCLRENEILAQHETDKIDDDVDGAPCSFFVDMKRNDAYVNFHSRRISLWKFSPRTRPTDSIKRSISAFALRRENRMRWHKM